MENGAQPVFAQLIDSISFPPSGFTVYTHMTQFCLSLCLTVTSDKAYQNIGKSMESSWTESENPALQGKNKETPNKNKTSYFMLGDPFGVED